MTTSQKPGRRIILAFKAHGLAYFYILSIALLFFQGACNSDYYYQKEIDLANGQWAYNDTLRFRFSIDDTLEIYNIYLDISYADTFSTQNVYMKLHTLFPDGKRLSKLKSFDLFDLQGKPLGACSGRRCRLHALLQENAFFNSPGEYEITLEQYTRANPLPGVYAIGLALESTGAQR